MPKYELEVLSALDQARLQLYHFTAIVIAGMGFFTDAYDLFCISTVTRLLGRIYYFDHKGPGKLPANVSAAVYAVALCGTLAGQLFFGWMGDKLGRKKAYGITLMLMVVASIASGLSFGSTAKSVMTTLCFCRFWLGFGIGGDYPLSATIMCEYANKKTRGAFIAAVFAMQGIGMLAGGAVAILVSGAFTRGYKDNPGGSTTREADYVWRIILMLGAIPAALTYYWRMRMPETARYTALIELDEKRAASDMAKVLHMEINVNPRNVRGFRRINESRFGLFSKEFTRRHGWHLLGTTSTWFFFDIAFYSQNLFQKDIFTAVHWLPRPQSMNAIEEVYRIARAQTIITLCSTVPGYWFTVVFVDHIGRKSIQLMGFFFMTLFMFTLAIPYHHWVGGGHQAGFLVLYSFTFFFSNFGPNATTFIVPAEIFPARIRSTCHGISAAAGKAGAIIGYLGFAYAAERQVDPGYHTGIGMKHSLLCLGVTNAIGFLCTFLIPETKGKSLEQLSRENEDEENEGIEVTVKHTHSGRRTAPIEQLENLNFIE